MQVKGSKVQSQNAGEKRGSFLGILSNASWMTVARLGGDVSSAFLFVVISRRFGVVGTGQYAYGFAIANIGMAIVNLGLLDFGLREYSRLPLAEKPLIFGRIVGIQCMTLAVVVLGLGGFIASARPAAETTAIILLLTTYQVALTLAPTFFIPAFARQAMMIPAVAELVCRGGSIVIASLFIFSGLDMSLSTALLPLPIGAGVLLAFATLSARHYNGSLRIYLNWTATVRVMQMVWPFAASVFIVQLYSRIDLIMLSTILGDESAGIYAAGIKFFEVGLMPVVLLAIAVYPAMSQQVGHNQREFSEMTDKFLRTSLLLGGLLAWALFFLVPLGLTPLLGEKFTASTSVVQMAAVLSVIVSIDLVVTRLLLVLNLQIRRTGIQLIGIILNAVLNFMLIPSFGVHGAMGAWIISQTSTNLIYIRMLRNRAATQDILKAMVLFSIPLSAAIGITIFLISLHVHTLLVAGAALVTFCVAASGTGFAPSMIPLLKHIKGDSYAP
jgi:O-antigen/teichoic acid export membrane protein